MPTGRSQPYDVVIHAAPRKDLRAVLRRVGRIAGLTAGALWIGLLITGFVLIAVDTSDPKLKAPILALYLEDGVVFADVLACGPDRVRSFYVDGYGRWSVLADLRRPELPAVTTFRLFDVPEGWFASGAEPFLSHPTLDPQGRYLVWLRTERGDQAAFAFQASLLAETTPATVISVTEGNDRYGDEHSALMPRTEFDERAAAYCRQHP